MFQRHPPALPAPLQQRPLRWTGAALPLLVVATVIGGCSGPPVAVSGGESVQDVEGRSVELPPGAPRLLVDDGRYLVALSLLHPDPVSLVAGWPHDVNRIGEETYRAWLERFPGLADLPRVSASGEDFSLEMALAAEPSVAIVTRGVGPGSHEVRLLEEAGIPVVYLDFVANPLENMDSSLEILGAIVGRQEQAAALVALRRERRDHIASRLADAASHRLDVFVETHAGLSRECCTSPGRGSLGEYVALAGGHNIGGDVLPGTSGRLNLEYILSRDPALYLLTGGPHLKVAGGLEMGSGYSREEAAAALRKMVERPGLRFLGAVESGRVHGLSHQLLNSPLDIVVLELLARWIHPELFPDLDPSATLAQINERFLAVPMEGTYWVDLEGR